MDTRMPGNSSSIAAPNLRARQAWKEKRTASVGSVRLDSRYQRPSGAVQNRPPIVTIYGLLLVRVPCHRPLNVAPARNGVRHETLVAALRRIGNACVPHPVFCKTRPRGIAENQANTAGWCHERAVVLELKSRSSLHIFQHKAEYAPKPTTPLHWRDWPARQIGQIGPLFLHRG